jgi:aryl-alcohol dehydrogenase-like predicted oxidoreductase
MAQTYGIATIPWSPLAGGMLTGKYRRGEPMPEDGRWSLNQNPNYQRRWNDRIWDVLEGLEPIAAEKGVSMSQFALAWVMAQPGVTSPIIGPRTMEQLDDNLLGANVEITREDLKAVDQIIPPGQMVSPYYEAEFGPHPYRV